MGVIEVEQGTKAGRRGGSAGEDVGGQGIRSRKSGSAPQALACFVPGESSQGVDGDEARSDWKDVTDSGCAGRVEVEAQGVGTTREGDETAALGPAVEFRVACGGVNGA